MKSRTKALHFLIELSYVIERKKTFPNITDIIEAYILPNGIFTKFIHLSSSDLD